MGSGLVKLGLAVGNRSKPTKGRSNKGKKQGVVVGEGGALGIISDGMGIMSSSERVN